jgi:hypothetical protein
MNRAKTIRYNTFCPIFLTLHDRNFLTQFLKWRRKIRKQPISFMIKLTTKNTNNFLHTVLMTNLSYFVKLLYLPTFGYILSSFTLNFKSRINYASFS